MGAKSITFSNEDYLNFELIGINSREKDFRLAWFLNKDMPDETRQYEDDSIVQQRMEVFTGLQQKRDRIMLGKPNRTETLNLFTPK